MSELKVIILAAGKGTRMKSELPKVILPICGVPMVQYVIWEAIKLSTLKPLVVVGYKGEKVTALLEDGVEYVWQKEQLGTGHAVKVACEEITSFSGDILVLYGDTPFISAQSLQTLVNEHRSKGVAATVLTAEMEKPTGYGRIIRSTEGLLVGITEERDASEQEKLIQEVNTGIYCFSYHDLQETILQLKPQNAQGEYYLTDAIALLASKGKPLHAVKCSNPEEIMGPNDRKALAKTESVMRAMILDRLMDDGVSIIDPATTYVDPRVKVGQDTTIYPSTILLGKTEISSNCHIGPFTQIADSIIGEGCQVHFSTLSNASLGKEVEIGPYTHLRPGTIAADFSKIGGFVEVKNSQIGEGSKVPHLSYIGDSQIGSDVNIGAGTITCNFDGVNKWKTTIGNGAFVGSNTNLVAPVSIGDKALIGAGSTITKDVPAHSVAIARAQQICKVVTPTCEQDFAAEGSRIIAILCATEGAIIHYSIDGKEPTKDGLCYRQPLLLTEGTILKAKAFKEGWCPSKTMTIKIGAE